MSWPPLSRCRRGRPDVLGVVSYGMGNIASVMNALDFLGVPARAAGAPGELDGCDRILLPGVGAFPAAMGLLGATGFRDALPREVERGKPLLGICLGMQLLAGAGEEFETTEGLGLIAGRVVPIPRAEGLRLPHMGWNELHLARSSALTEGLAEGESCYFVHGFHVVCDDPGAVVATTEHGGPLAAVIEGDGVWGTQFHPEKSQDTGLAILRNFAGLPC